MGLGPPPVATMTDAFRGWPESRYAVFDRARDEGGWNLLDDGLLDESHNIPGGDLTAAETLWIDAWDEFAVFM